MTLLYVTFHHFVGLVHDIFLLTGLKLTTNNIFWCDHILHATILNNGCLAAILSERYLTVTCKVMDYFQLEPNSSKIVNQWITRIGPEIHFQYNCPFY